MLSYWFWPNPGGAGYGNPKFLALAAVCVLMIAASWIVGVWRERQRNAVTRKLCRSWPAALRWFGFLGIVLAIARVEEIQFLAMRFLWLVWALAMFAYAAFQAWRFRRMHYTVVRERREADPREAYLPRGRS